MFDFIFRRGNPTNSWRRSDNLALVAALDEPSLNGVRPGARLDSLSWLGRNNSVQVETFCYHDLGVGIEFAEDGTLHGYSIILADEHGEYQPYRGAVTWNGSEINLHQLTVDKLASIIGEWYWMDTDENESIVFYEYQTHELQIELSTSGSVRRFIVTKDPLMADVKQRELYGVDIAWPPQFRT